MSGSKSLYSTQNSAEESRRRNAHTKDEGPVVRAEMRRSNVAQRAARDRQNRLLRP
jgi:hypothetical protein